MWHGQTHHLGVSCWWLLEHVFPIWSLHLVLLSMATRTHRCGKDWVCAGVESCVSGLFPGNRKVHKPGWPQGILLPSSTDCPRGCVPVKGWGSSTGPGTPHTTSTSGGSRCACAADSSFTREILWHSMSLVVMWVRLRIKKIKHWEHWFLEHILVHYLHWYFLF